jgi:hypothetical protein
VWVLGFSGGGRCAPPPPTPPHLLPLKLLAAVFGLVETPVYAAPPSRIVQHSNLSPAVRAWRQ